MNSKAIKSQKHQHRLCWIICIGTYIAYTYHLILLLWLLENGNLKKKKVGIVMNRMGQLLWLYQPYLQECHSSTVWSLWVKQKRWLFSAVFKSNRNDWFLEDFTALWNGVVLISSNLTVEWQGNYSETRNVSAKKRWFFNVLITSNRFFIPCTLQYSLIHKEPLLFWSLDLCSPEGKYSFTVNRI